MKLQLLIGMCCLLVLHQVKFVNAQNRQSRYISLDENDQLVWAAGKNYAIGVRGRKTGGRLAARPMENGKASPMLICNLIRFMKLN